MVLALLMVPGARYAMAQTTAQSSGVTAVTHGDDGEAANRKALEDQAGKNAAKLMLRSTPDKSSVRIDGKPVGTTPLLLILKPGVYVVEMEGGPREDYARRQVDLLPKEAREVTLELQTRYPSSIRLSWASHK
jgi:hypothetical protein